MKRRKKTTILFLAVLVTAFYLSSCGPRDESKPTYYIDQDTRDFCVFNEGSWWVYENEISKIIDTVRITKREGHTKSGREISYNLSGVYLQFSSSLNNSEKRKWAGGDLINPNLNIIELPEGAGNLYTFISITDTSFRFTPYSNAEIKLDKIYDSLRINDDWHKEVREIRNLKYLKTNSPQAFWWSRNIGMIKKQDVDGSSWNLLNYNVKQ